MLLFEGIWTLGLWVRKAVESFKCCLMSHTSRSMEDSGAESNLMNCGTLLRRLQRSMWTGDSSCDILVKKVAAFLLCPKSLPEAKVKTFKLKNVQIKKKKAPGSK